MPLSCASEIMPSAVSGPAFGLVAGRADLAAGRSRR
jgi:hypothetical protein